MEQIGLVDGVSRAFKHMGSSVESLSIQFRIFLSLLLVLGQEMDLGCYFGMISGARNNLLSFNSQIFSGSHL